MNSVLASRRLVQFSALTSLALLAAFGVALLLDGWALPLFGLTASALVTLIVVGDYGARRQPRALSAVYLLARRNERMALAA